MHVWMFWNSRFRRFLFMFMTWLWIMWLMIWFDSYCYGFLSMPALICIWFHEKWYKIEWVTLIWKWALGLRRCTRFWTSGGWRWCGGTSWLVHFWNFGLFEFLFYKLISMIYFLAQKGLENSEKIVINSK